MRSLFRSLFEFKKIKPRMIFWFFSAVLLPMIVVISVIYHQRAIAIKTEAFAKLTAIRDLKVSQLNLWLDERKGDIEAISRDLEIRQLAALIEQNTLNEQNISNGQSTGNRQGTVNWQKTDNWRNTEDDLKIIESARATLTSFLEEYTAYLEIFIINASTGMVEISTESSSEGTNLSKAPFFIETLKSESLYIRDIYFSSKLKKPTMCFSHPIYNPGSSDGNPSGVLVTLFDLEKSLYALLLQRTGMGKTGETLIVNRDVMALSDLRWHNNAPLRMKIQAEPAVLASRGLSGIVESRDYRDEDVLASYAFIPVTQWGFVAKQDLSEIYAPINSMLFNMAIILILAALAAYALAHMLALNFSKPVIEVTNAALKIQGGDLSARCNIGNEDEYGVLARAFNEMAESMETYGSIQKGLRRLDEILVISTTVHEFAAQFIEKLLDITNSAFGAFFLINEFIEFEHVYSSGFARGVIQSLDKSVVAGAFDRSYRSGSITYIDDISKDTVFTVNTIAGKAIPKCMVTVPVMIKGEVAAIIALGSLNDYSSAAYGILEQIQPAVGTALSNIISGEKTLALAQELTHKNSELEAQAMELQAMTDDLKRQNIELDVQSRQLEEASRLKSMFLSNMSHELRTPLNSVMALSSVLKMNRDKHFNSEEVEYLEVIERNGRRLLDLINDILDLSKIEAGHMDVNLSFFSFKTAIENIVENLQPLVREKGLSLHAQFSTDLPEIQSDEKRVYQILLNLMGNAIKFTEKGNVVVEAYCCGQRPVPAHMTTDIYESMICVKVMDTGIGIPEKELPFIFEEFRQVDGSTSRRHEGTGLGLAIAHKATLNLGGTLSVESKPGVGTTFTLKLPRIYQGEGVEGLIDQGDANQYFKPEAQEHNYSAALSDTPFNSVSTAPSKRLLLVEDNESAITQIKLILEHEGYCVDIARGGKEAQAMVAKSLPDGIILDLMMPDMDGFEVLEAIRCTERTATIPVLILTAKDLTPDDFKKLSANNIQQLVQKGDVEREGLLMKVKFMLGESTMKNVQAGGTRNVLEQQESPDPEAKPRSITEPEKDQNPEAKPRSITEPEKDQNPEAKSRSTTEPQEQDVPKTGISPELPPRIVVIEDNPDNMITIKALLKGRYTVIEAYDGENGLKTVFENLPDLILLDISLPGMDGYTLVKEFKDHEKTKMIPVIALTAHAMKGDKDNLISAGCDDYLSKPIEPVKILQTIEKWIAGRE
ncbi:putative Histidine kinase [Desulfamplus magnetovallimortis]|uniref:histidine kinase n=1 Tax=Desulfamplus magnetovallimortis TaxID=1246637 RepID=A0A1W1HAW3_9BACT|nr:response regulator [Desulfamplus magnetovallimortis]SLM29634.1 putative Histidine kinase [Desulfamplus magnetovallimortis]